jgi:Ca2+-binding RTX toxin-like protein
MHRGVVGVHGTRNADSVVITADATHVHVDVNSVVKSFDRAKVRGVVVDGRAGDDSLGVDDADGTFDIPVALLGGKGTDMLVGGSGNDYLHGGEGDDFLFGMGGHDKLRGGRGNDLMSGGDGNDHMRGGAGDDLMGGGADDDVIRGGTGVDFLDGEGGNDDLVE